MTEQDFPFCCTQASRSNRICFGGLYNITGKSTAPAPKARRWVQGEVLPGKRAVAPSDAAHGECSGTFAHRRCGGKDTYKHKKKPTPAPKARSGVQGHCPCCLRNVHSKSLDVLILG